MKALGTFIGVVINVDPAKYTDRIQVRVPMLHGVPTDSDNNDEDLPWIKVIFAPGQSASSLNSLYSTGDLVYVNYQKDDSDGIVQGIYLDNASVNTNGLTGGTRKEGGAGRVTTSQVSPGATYVRKSSLSEEFGKPLKTINVTSEYGSRWGSKHWGVDLGAALGTPVFASLDGIIHAVTNGFPSPSAGVNAYDGSSMDSYGNYVIIDHGVLSDSRHYYTKYAHLTKAEVVIGQIVKKGDPIGTSGSSGNSSGGHLHFEVDVNGTYASNGENPREYIDF